MIAAISDLAATGACRIVGVPIAGSQVPDDANRFRSFLSLFRYFIDILSTLSIFTHFKVLSAVRLYYFCGEDCVVMFATQRCVDLTSKSSFDQPSFNCHHHETSYTIKILGNSDHIQLFT